MDEKLHQLNRRYVAAISAADGAYYRWAVQSGVTPHTLDLLYALNDGMPHSQKQICEEWGIPKTTVNTVVKACQAAGYITLEPMPGRPRQRQLCLTEAGQAYAREALAELYLLEDQAMAAAVERYGATFVDAMELYCASFRAALEASLSKKKEDNSL
ncbi:MAG: MarR family winged helix-turn-helix transcriptional regulator [Oscillospiraceae bacterium]|nr:MarR family winged helix-turn-helix transcriptional regulator [Oscillospiraceae bacterium]